jgi:hypothetical protein
VITPLRVRAFRLVQHERKGPISVTWYLWAMHPAIAAGSVHHVHAVSSRATPLPRLAARPHGPPLLFHVLLQHPKTEKALSLIGKGLDLRKLVAGAGFEPATSGL